MSSNSIFREQVKEDHDNEDEEELELSKLCKDDEEFVDEGDNNKDEELVDVTITGDDNFLELHKDDVDKKDEELVDVIVTCDDEFVEKKQEQLGEGLLDDENDGFRTPTSIEHRIPVPTQCPPAPKKSCKRKFEGSSIVEIIRSATKVIHDQFLVFKKTRRDDDGLS
ncbi:uncharacterized protein LOC141708814 [Apium graveolens]|uniref:uncharacterized protein LOC141708814 n=1 Tax=Apium graveolens TaxID=4045 RepID=UPI003D7C03A2